MPPAHDSDRRRRRRKLTTALLDRLAHHATVITTKGKSYRMRKRRGNGSVMGTTSKNDRVGGPRNDDRRVGQGRLSPKSQNGGGENEQSCAAVEIQADFSFFQEKRT